MHTNTTLNPSAHSRFAPDFLHTPNGSRRRRPREWGGRTGCITSHSPLRDALASVLVERACIKVARAVYTVWRRTTTATAGNAVPSMCLWGDSTATLHGTFLGALGASLQLTPVERAREFGLSSATRETRRRRSINLGQRRVFQRAA